MKELFKKGIPMFLLLALIVGVVPSVLAAGEDGAMNIEAVAEASALEPEDTEEPPASPSPEPEEDSAAEAIEAAAVLDVPTAYSTGLTGTMSKSTCVYLGYYESARWYCSRYETTGEHASGHICTTDSIHYHHIDGEIAYCIAPNYQSSAGKVYSGYDASSASGSSYWMLELDATQRSYIQQILACGYPSVDRGYSQQVQFAATQSLIWEVVMRLRYDGIQSCSSDTLYRKIYSVLGSDYRACYEEILGTISISNGEVPSFSSASSSSPATVTLVYNSATNCYEAEVTDSNGVLPYYTFAQSGVTFTTSGNTLKISVPADAASGVKGQTITGTSAQMDMDTSDPVIWENPYYQTVITNGGAEQAKAYIRLDWEDAPQTGSLTVRKAVNYGSWQGFTFRLYGTSDRGSAVDLTAVTDSDGAAYFNDVETGTYTLEEIDPGQQYILPEAVTVTIPEDDAISVTVDNVWKHWYAKVTKVDADTGTAQGNASLNGAEYTLYRRGEAVATYTVKNGGFETDAFPCTEDDGIYTLKETKAPAGYLLDETVYKLSTSCSHYANAENSFTVTVSDTVIRGNIRLEKWAINTVSGEKRPEAGAAFEVWLKSAGSYAAAKSTERDIITIGEDGVGTTKDLPYGVYYLKQVSGWEGYSPDETVYEVSITEDGETVTQDTTGDDLIIFNDIWTGTLRILKVDGSSKEPLAGAEFTLNGTDDSEVKEVSDETGSVVFENLVYGVDYTWTETAAPHGYLLSDESTGTVSVEEADAEIEVTAENERRPGSITVTKQNMDGDPLFDCTFLLEYLDGDEWKPVFQSEELTPGGCSSNLIDSCLTTGESGIVAFEGLWADDALQYRLTEVSAPEGYELLAEPTFEGVLPVGYPEGEVTAEPDEVIDGTAYFYTLPITVRDGHIYTLPMTGGSGFPFAAVGVIVLFTGGLLLVNGKYPYILKNIKRRYFV